MQGKKKRLEHVHGILDNQTRKAEQGLISARAQLRSEYERLEQIQAMRGEYNEKARTLNDVRNPFFMDDFNTFITRIDQAISQQQNRIAQAEHVVAQRQSDYQAVRTRSEGIGRLVDKEQRRDDAQQQREEQQTNDLMAQVRYQQALA